MTTAKRTLPIAKRGLSFEMIMWVFTRVTVIAMYGLMLAGFIGALIVSAQLHANFGDVLRWAFFPNAVANPLSSMLWMTILAKLMVSAFVLVVCGHGVHGVLEILDDYFTGVLARRWFRNIIILYAIVACIIALYVIWTS